MITINENSDKNELMKDALRALLRARPDLRKDIAVELYRRRKVSLSRAAEIYGSNIEDFREVLRERGVKIEIPHLSIKEIDEEVERILLL